MATNVGSDEEQVRLFIADEEITNIYQNYSIAVSVFEQPAGFTLKLGDGATIADLRSRFKKGDPFRLWIGNQQIAAGIIDGRGASGTPSVMNFRGRDHTSVLMESYVAAAQTFQNETYVQLTEKVLELCGVEDPKVFTDNDKARQSFSGIKMVPTYHGFRTSDAKSRALAERYGFQAIANTAGDGLAGDVARSAADGLGYVLSYIPVIERRQEHHQVTAKVGQTWWDFLQEQYKKVGLFLWCTPEGDFVLTEPNTTQEPVYRIFRERGATRNAVNVTEASLNEGHPGNHLECIAYGRTGRGKNGRLQCRGIYKDVSRFAESLRYRVAFVDDDLESNEEAEFAARRRIAEERRRSRTLSYKVSGHKVQAMNGTARAIWTPDTIVDVDDREYGITEPLYLHSVTFERNPETTTILDLAWPEDIVFSQTSAPPPTATAAAS